MAADHPQDAAGRRPGNVRRRHEIRGPEDRLVEEPVEGADAILRMRRLDDPVLDPVVDRQAGERLQIGRASRRERWVSTGSTRLAPNTETKKNTKKFKR